MSESKDKSGNMPQRSMKIPAKLPVMPLYNEALFPVMIIPVEIVEDWANQMLSEAAIGDRLVGLFTVKNESKEGAKREFYPVGTAAIIQRMMRTPNNRIQVILQGIQRVVLKNIENEKPYIVASVAIAAETLRDDVDFEGKLRAAMQQFQDIIREAPYIPNEIGLILNSLETPGQKIDFMAAHLNLKKEEQLQLIEELNVNERLNIMLKFLERELEVLKLGTRIHQEMQQSMTKMQREAYLRQQLETIKKELGETDEQTAILNELRQKVEKARLPEEALKMVNMELERIAQIPPASPEFNVSRTYLDWVVNLPWSVSTVDNLDIERAKKVLDEDHYDLEKIKERILDYLAVGKLKQDLKGPILCFVGPPGTGKTSLGQSIARVLERKFVRISLGGMRDEAEIRGHRRTYIGALPGRFIQQLRRAASNNPVIMLDEIDKVGSDYRGDPSSALLEVLDPEQNNTFTDHYLDLPFDLSKVLFITTANILDTIPPPLLDRMEVIELSGYTEFHKLQIARQYLIPKQIEAHGLQQKQVVFEDAALIKIIRQYVREAGLRNLERSIGEIFRKTARRVVEGAKTPVHIDEAAVQEILGVERFLYDMAEEKDEIGVVTGMAWTPVGGDVIFVEAMAVTGTGHLKLTGRMGEVMRESAEAAMTYVRSRAQSLGIPENFYQNQDIHIHIPEGAVPKDGPSAGVTLTTALASALTKRPVRHDIAMTGEITLRGKVLPVGGIRDKVLAAHRSGIRTIILPKENERHIEDIPEQVRKELIFIFVVHLDEVMNSALRPPIGSAAVKPAAEKSGEALTAKGKE